MARVIEQKNLGQSCKYKNGIFTITNKCGKDIIFKYSFSIEDFIENSKKTFNFTYRIWDWIRNKFYEAQYKNFLKISDIEKRNRLIEYWESGGKYEAYIDRIIDAEIDVFKAEYAKYFEIKDGVLKI